MRRFAFPFWLCFSLLTFGSIALAAQLMSVQVKHVPIMPKPTYFSIPTGKMVYGDRVAITKETGEWRKFSLPRTGQSGWVHISALTEKEVILRPTNRQIEISRQSAGMTLAGSGFNKQVELEYQSRHKLDYTSIDAMETSSVSQEEVVAFAKSGDLNAEGSR